MSYSTARQHTPAGVWHHAHGSHQAPVPKTKPPRCCGLSLQSRRQAALGVLLLSFLWLCACTMAPRRYPPLVPGVKRLQLPSQLPAPPVAGTVEVVVARYSDDLAWLPALAALLNANMTVYCKARHPLREPRGVGGSPNADSSPAAFCFRLTRSLRRRRLWFPAPRRLAMWETRGTATCTTWWSATTALPL